MRVVFDSHVHYSFAIPLAETVTLFRREFAMTDTARMVFLSLPHHEKNGVLTFDPTQNVKGLYLKTRFAPDAYAFAGLEHTGTALSEDERSRMYLLQAERAMAAGFDGFKMLEGYPGIRKVMGIPLCHPVYDRFYSYLEENRIPVVMHLANPEEYWDPDRVDEYAKKVGRFCDETYPTKAQLHGEVDEILKKHPKLRLTLAHFGFLTYRIEDAEAWLERHENTMLDITPGGEQYFNMLSDWPRWEEFLHKYRSRILYGTDFYAFPYNDEERWMQSVMNRPRFVRQFFETDTEHTYQGQLFCGVKLDDAVISDIYWNNAVREYGAPKPVDLSYLRQEAERLLTLPGTDADDMRYILNTI